MRCLTRWLVEEAVLAIQNQFILFAHGRLQTATHWWPLQTRIWLTSPVFRFLSFSVVLLLNFVPPLGQRPSFIRCPTFQSFPRKRAIWHQNSVRYKQWKKIVSWMAETLRHCVSNDLQWEHKMSHKPWTLHWAMTASHCLISNDVT